VGSILESAVSSAASSVAATASGAVQSAEAAAPDLVKGVEGAAKTYADYSVGVAEGAWAGVQGLASAAQTATDVMDGVALNKALTKLGTAAIDEKARKELVKEAGDDWNKAKAAAEFAGNAVNDPVGTGIKVGKQVKAGYDKAAAAGHGAEFIGKGVGQAAMIVGASLVGAGEAEAAGLIGEGVEAAGAAGEAGVMAEAGVVEGGEVAGEAAASEAGGAASEAAEGAGAEAEVAKDKFAKIRKPKSADMELANTDPNVPEQMPTETDIEWRKRKSILDRLGKTKKAPPPPAQPPAEKDPWGNVPDKDIDKQKGGGGAPVILG
jgi:hypothetical protein